VHLGRDPEEDDGGCPGPADEGARDQLRKGRRAQVLIQSSQFFLFTQIHCKKTEDQVSQESGPNEVGR